MASMYLQTWLKTHFVSDFDFDLVITNSRQRLPAKHSFQEISRPNLTSEDLPVVDAITIRIEAEKEYPSTSKSRASQDR
jgi:hypothetical protein